MTLVPELCQIQGNQSSFRVRFGCFTALLQAD